MVARLVNHYLTQLPTIFKKTNEKGPHHPRQSHPRQKLSPKFK